MAIEQREEREMRTEGPNQVEVPSQVIGSAAQFASEAAFTGAANLIKGDVKQFAIHGLLGFAARAMFGMPGGLLISTNSFIKATTGLHLYEHLGMRKPSNTVGTVT
jgi:hypothetical protein